MAQPPRLLLLLLTIALLSLHAHARTYYTPTASSTYNKPGETQHITTTFQLSYLDDSSLKGYLCEDHAHLGAFHARAAFGCITNSSGNWSHVDGILGLSPAVSKALPSLLDTLSGRARRPPSILDPTPPNLMPRRLFSLLLSKHGGHLDLGGYDPASFTPPLVSAPLQKECKGPDGSTDCAIRSYSIQVQSLRLADAHISKAFTFASGTTAVVDSGTSCLLLPGKTKLNPQSAFNWFESALSTWPDLTTTRPDVYVKINGWEFRVPFDDFILNADKPDVNEWRQCIGTDAQMPDVFLLGDVFMRNVLVVHNLTHDDAPELLLAQRNYNYSLATAPATHTLTRTRVPRPDRTRTLHVLALDTASGSTSTVPVTNADQLQYTTTVSLGTPLQNLNVVVDTGSGAFAVFTREQSFEAFPWWQYSLIGVAIIAAVLVWAYTRWKVRRIRSAHYAELNTLPEEYARVAQTGHIPHDFLQPVVPTAPRGTQVQPPPI